MAIRPSRANTGKGTAGVFAGTPVAGRTMTTAGVFALWIVVVAACAPNVIFVSAAATAPAGAVASCRVMTDDSGRTWRSFAFPLPLSVTAMEEGRVIGGEG